MLCTHIKPHFDLPKDFGDEDNETFILEAQLWVEMEGYKHVGYMKALFNFRNEAADYYNIHNSHMRKLNALHTWRSDWDKNTKLRYVVRSYQGEILDFPPFNISDAPIIREVNGGVITNYPTSLSRDRYPAKVPVLKYTV